MKKTFLTERDLLAIKPKDYEGRALSEEEIFLWLNAAKAGWIHDSDSQKPHTEMYGLCSNGYFDLSQIVRYPNLNQILAQQLFHKLKDKGVEKVGWVVSSSPNLFAYEIARVFEAIYIFVDIEAVAVVWQWKIPRKAKVLQVEDILVTDRKLIKVRQIISRENQEEVEFMPVAAALIYRPQKLPEVREIVGLIEKEIWEVSSRECPLCAVGSPPLNPKTHWSELIGME